MTSQTGQQIITNTRITQYLKNSRRNLTITFHQLIEYNISNIFLEKSYSKSGEEASFRPLYKKIKIEHILGSTTWNIVKIVFGVCQSRDLPKYIKNKALTTYFFTLKYKAF